MNTSPVRSLLLVLSLLLLSGALAGCASKKTANAPVIPEDVDTVSIPDPIEPWNRFWFVFNDKFYMFVGKPFSKAYTTAVPKYARERIESAYSNFLAPARFVNALFQLRPDKASRELGRFIINSTFGLGGLYDLAATKEDMGPQRLDFGQTLGVWGAGHGFYLVLPIIGPSSLRDGIGMAVDATVQPTTYIDAPYILTLLASGAGRINRLAETLKVYEELKRSAIEPYSAARDAYAQYRLKHIQDAIDSAWVKPSKGE
ncbi:MAG: MlaA family lipoprotein [Thermodesulfobacteriota bacterium]